MTVACSKQIASLLLLAVGLAFAFSAVPAIEAATAKAGKYRGKTGTTGRISFKVDRTGRKMTKLNVSIFALGQDTYGNFTKYSLLASKTDNRRFRIRRSGRFTAAGQDKNGIEYKVIGKLSGKRKFKGTAEMKRFQLDRYEYNWFTGLSEPVYELVSGSRRYTAKN